MGLMGGAKLDLLSYQHASCWILPRGRKSQGLAPGTEVMLGLLR